MATYETTNNNSAIAAVAIVVLVLLALAGGWVLLANTEGRPDRDFRIELPGRD